MERRPRSITDLSPAHWKAGLILHGRPLLSTSTKNSNLKSSCSTPDQKPLCNLFDSHIKVPLGEKKKKSTSDQLKRWLWFSKNYFIGKHSLNWLVHHVDSVLTQACFGCTCGPAQRKELSDSSTCMRCLPIPQECKSEACLWWVDRPYGEY